ncbi:MAG: HAD-IA family hydrolase [Elusimicrobiota bacterium]
MKNIELLIFDLDGTLADTKPDVTDGVNYALKYFGCPSRTQDEVAASIGPGQDVMLKKSFGTFTKYDLNVAIKKFNEYYSVHYADKTYLFPGMMDMLKHYNNKRKAVVTNKLRKYSEPLLAKLGALDQFDIVVGMEDVEKCKPDPYPLLLVAKKYGIAPEKSVMVGDSPSDIQAGKAAGMFTVGLTFGMNPAEIVKSANPDYLLDDILQMLNIFE